MDTGQDLYDSTAAWRERAMTGTLYSGTLVSDPRSDDRAAPDLHSHPNGRPETGPPPRTPFGVARAVVPAGLADAHSGTADLAQSKADDRA